MDKIFEALIKLIPFALLFEKLGISKEWSVVLSGLISIILVLYLAALSKSLIQHYKNSRAARSLSPYFDYRKVKASRELFIPTKFQNNSPTYEEEPQFTHKFIAKIPLIPFFIKTVFDEKKESEKFYLVLADSGMGKTTFMINLHLKYTSFFNFGRKYKIRLFPFGYDGNILDKIKKIDPKEVPDTILLLDAFDEDKGLIPSAETVGLSDDERFRKRMDEIIETVKDFREVVITSRTQYFPGQENAAYELKIPSLDEKGFHKLAKLYLSPFDNKEIKRYLGKKYGVLKIWNRKKKQIAATIVEKSPKLMARPMLLSYIDYLADNTDGFKNTYEIYETLVNKWIEREANKRKHQTVDREKFKKDLYNYSWLVAAEICKHRKDAASLCLKKEGAIKIAQDNKIDLQGYEITGQSLLTRDAEGNWKFAHKSIFEFLIAAQANENIEPWFWNVFDGMDMTKKFLSEKLPGMPMPWDFVSIKGGSFLMGSPESEAERMGNETQHQVKVDDFYMAKYTVTEAQFETFIKETGVDRRLDELQKDKQHRVINVSWNDATAYCQWISKKWNKTFRLPTEAEWEYACRAGTAAPFNTGGNLTTEQANYNGKYPYKNYPKGKRIGKTTPVGSYPPNAWGLYDMHGNVWEWCEDWFGAEYYDVCKKRGIADNPKGPEAGSGCVLRGGSWNDNGQFCRCASRISGSPDDRGSNVGFRLVFVP